MMHIEENLAEVGEEIQENAERSVKLLFEKLQEKSDFDYFAVTNVSPLRNSHHQEAINNSDSNFPVEWIQHYMGSKLYLDDPVVDFATLTTTATDWRELDGLIAYEKRHDKVLGAARDRGIRSGVFMSTRQINGDIQLISFANSVERTHSNDELHAATMYGQLIGKALNDQSFEDKDESSLQVSAREMECLSLSAIGKSSAEIELILGISRHTVDFHIKNVMAKLDATTRTYAIVKAIRLGIINP